MLRYCAEGEVHKDFHGLTCATLHYLLDNYGEDAVREILTKTAQQVYRSMHEKLKQGDPSELLEFWEYYQKREGGDFKIERAGNEIRLIVRDCPALRHLVRLEQEPDPLLCRATGIFNRALVADSPYELETTPTGPFSCIQTLKRREEA